jgi:cell division septum initiation protein DivIVA
MPAEKELRELVDMVKAKLKAHDDDLAKLKARVEKLESAAKDKA